MNSKGRESILEEHQTLGHEERIFYSCLLIDLAYEWLRGCRRPYIDTDHNAFIL